MCGGESMKGSGEVGLILTIGIDQTNHPADNIRKLPLA